MVGSILIDLDSSQLYGTIEANCSLFHLKHLDVVDNNFNPSQIPSRIGELSQLSYVTISSSLQRLSLDHCELHGEFPSGIFQLQNLRYLNMGNRQNLTGSMPSSFGNLTQLMVLDIEHNKFRGHLSSFLENLSKLRTLIVGWNEFITGTFSWICKLSGIYVLDIDLVNIDSQIPLCFANLTQLSRFSLFHSYLSGPIPSWIMNQTNLAYMDLPGCNLHGAIPNSLFKLENLEVFNVAYNLLEGELELHKFQSFKMHSMQPFLEFNC
ncbi:Receptor-like protein 35 [Glycine max]|nr:Receptor-like protein 35 [Glycine max]